MVFEKVLVAFGVFVFLGFCGSYKSIYHFVFTLVLGFFLYLVYSHRRFIRDLFGYEAREVVAVDLECPSKTFIQYNGKFMVSRADAEMYAANEMYFIPRDLFLQHRAMWLEMKANSKNFQFQVFGRKETRGEITHYEYIDDADVDRDSKQIMAWCSGRRSIPVDKINGRALYVINSDLYEKGADQLETLFKEQNVNYEIQPTSWIWKLE